MSVLTPGYRGLYQSGELARRAEMLRQRLRACDVCPRDCRVNRLHGETGYCHAGLLPIVASYCDHHGEEPAISGSRGSGTIFFGNCNLRCVYCQNHQISQDYTANRRHEVSIRALAGYMLEVQDRGCHNINLVTPSHFVPQIVAAVQEAAAGGLSIPLVYNTSSYDDVTVLRTLDGMVDIYLADLRYAANDSGKKYSGAVDYADRARVAIREMYRQVGNLVTDADGVARRGLIIRHLVLPQGIAGSRAVLTWLAQELSPEVTVSVMSQYYPAHRAGEYPEIARRITPEEYGKVVQLVNRLGLENGWLQDDAAAEYYLPDFRREDPFSGR